MRGGRKPSYAIYDEVELLDSGDLDLPSRERARPPTAQLRAPRRARRMAVTTATAVVIGAAVGLVAVSGLRVLMRATSEGGARPGVLAPGGAATQRLSAGRIDGQPRSSGGEGRRVDAHEAKIDGATSARSPSAGRDGHRSESSDGREPPIRAGVNGVAAGAEFGFER